MNDTQWAPRDAGVDPGDEDLMMQLDHEAWKELGVDSGITRAKLLLFARRQFLAAELTPRIGPDVNISRRSNIIPRLSRENTASSERSLSGADA